LATRDSSGSTNTGTTTHHNTQITVWNTRRMERGRTGFRVFKVSHEAICEAGLMLASASADSNT